MYTTFKVKRSRSPGCFTHRRVGTSGSCSGGHRNMMAVRNCWYVAVCSAARGPSAPTGRVEGRGISWWPTTYSLLALPSSIIIINVLKLFFNMRLDVILRYLAHKKSKVTL